MKTYSYISRTVKTENMSTSFSWDPDPLYFAFRDEVPGRVRMHTHRLNWEDWIKIDDSYPDQMRLRNEIVQRQKVAEANKW